MTRMARSKKDIDKELMYQKLMPSHAKQRTDAEKKTEPVISKPVQAAPKAPTEHVPQKPHKVHVPALDSHRTEVINVMEEIVISKLDSVLSRFRCCRCDRCKKDIIALALNKLPPKYRVLDQGQVPPDIDAQTNAQVVTAMIQAVIQVRAKPRH